MAVPDQATGRTFGRVDIVFDSQGVAIPPRRPYQILEAWERLYRSAWPDLEAMAASLEAADPVVGLPEGAPDPNRVYAEDGRLFRYICDPDRAPQIFVQQLPDGTEQVTRKQAFRKQWVALTLEGARAATDRRGEDEPETDFWCGFCWIRGGYSQEIFAPVAVKHAQAASPSALVFEQPVSPSDLARLRHDMRNLDRSQPTLPVEPPPPGEPDRGRSGKKE